MGSVNLLIAFVAGVLSFFSPCVLPLVPGFIGLWAGTLTDKKNRRPRLIGSTILFVVGFSVVFTLLGLSAGFVGEVLKNNLLRIVFGVLIILFGLHLADLFRIPFLEREKRPFLQTRAISPAKSFLMGLGFALGWSPCIGPVLASILMMASQVGQALKATILLLVFSLGLGFPFLLLAFFTSILLPKIRKIQVYLPIFQLGSGKLIAFLGFALATGSLQTLAELTTFGANFIAGVLLILLLILIEIRILVSGFRSFSQEQIEGGIPRYFSALFFVDFIFYVTIWATGQLIRMG